VIPDLLMRTYARTRLGSRLTSFLHRHGVYWSDGLATIHNHDFMDDPTYIAARQRGLESCRESKEQKEERRDFWRLHVALWGASHAVQLPGSFVECGVSYGFLSLAIMQYLDWNNRDKQFYLFDTFCGLDESLVSPEEFALGRVDQSRQMYSECYKDVQENFKEFNNVILMRGSVPSTLSTVEIPSVCYLHLDMNCAEPEIQAARFFWPKMVKGGVVLLDDYGRTDFAPQKKAFDGFTSEYDIRILSFPTGQGMFLKP